ncbi:hypothetical protein M9458_037672, partial [Cirrhinus mrigala]
RQDPRLHLGSSTLRLRFGSELSRLHHGLSSHHLHQAPSSLLLHVGQLSTIHHLWTSPRHSIPPALSGSSFPLAPPSSSVTPASLWSSGSPSPPHSPEPAASPQSPRLHVFSAPSWSPSMPASSQELTPLNPPPRFAPWLLPPVTPPWAFVLAGLWWSTSCDLLLWPTIHLNTLLTPHWLLPPSSPPPSCLFHPPSLRCILSSLHPIPYFLLPSVTGRHPFACSFLPLQTLRRHKDTLCQRGGRSVMVLLCLCL